MRQVSSAAQSSVILKCSKFIIAPVGLLIYKSDLIDQLGKTVMSCTTLYVCFCSSILSVIYYFGSYVWVDGPTAAKTP